MKTIACRQGYPNAEMRASFDHRHKPQPWRTSITRSTVMPMRHVALLPLDGELPLRARR
jgi:hypothetical protein